MPTPPSAPARPAKEIGCEEYGIAAVGAITKSPHGYSYLSLWNTERKGRPGYVRMTPATAVQLIAACAQYLEREAARKGVR